MVLSIQDLIPTVLAIEKRKRKLIGVIVGHFKEGK